MGTIADPTLAIAKGGRARGAAERLAPIHHTWAEGTRRCCGRTRATLTRRQKCRRFDSGARCEVAEGGPPAAEAGETSGWSAERDECPERLRSGCLSIARAQARLDLEPWKMEMSVGMREALSIVRAPGTVDGRSVEAFAKAKHLALGNMSRCAPRRTKTAGMTPGCGRGAQGPIRRLRELGDNLVKGRPALTTTNHRRRSRQGCPRSAYSCGSLELCA